MGKRITIPRSLRRQQETLRAAAKALEPKVVKQEVPLPDGLYQALQVKVQLQKLLQGQTRRAVTVGVDIMDNRWVLVVRGYRPAVSEYCGYTILYYRAGAVGQQAGG